MLMTTINQVQQRISMHGVRTALLDQQAEAIGLPLYKIELPENPGMAEYEMHMRKACSEMKNNGYTGAVFGDIYLEDLKIYREKQMAGEKLNCHFPLWKNESHKLIRQFISFGFKAIVVCTNSLYLDSHFCGRIIDESFLNDLPPDVDPCGENGEYHSFVFDGPLFKHPVNFEKGELVYREYPAPKSDADACFTTPKPAAGFYFCDLIPQ